MKVLIPYIFLLFLVVPSCTKDKSGSDLLSSDTTASKSDTLPVPNGTESTIENQGIGTSENGLSTDVAEDTVLKKRAK